MIIFFSVEGPILNILASSTDNLIYTYIYSKNRTWETLYQIAYPFCTLYKYTNFNKIVIFLNSEVKYYTVDMILIGCNTVNRRVSINILWLRKYSTGGTMGMIWYYYGLTRTKKILIFKVQESQDICACHKWEYSLKGDCHCSYPTIYMGLYNLLFEKFNLKNIFLRCGQFQVRSVSSILFMFLKQLNLWKRTLRENFELQYSTFSVTFAKLD